MRELGLPKQLVGWIMWFVSIVSYNILLNGKPMKLFPAKKGLRQGDPMSLYLFALAMEYLTRCLSSLRDSEFKFHPKCKRTSTIALLFVDDLLIFSYGNVQLVTLLK